jgi:hypothetical protein
MSIPGVLGSGIVCWCTRIPSMPVLVPRATSRSKLSTPYKHETPGAGTWKVLEPGVMCIGTHEV